MQHIFGKNIVKLANYNDILYKKTNLYIISTLPINDQLCLIQGTIPAEDEETIINKLLFNTNIIVYGKNHSDQSALKKYNQLVRMGYRNVYVYKGGLFEWLMLQDIYSSNLFLTTSVENDIIKFKPISDFPE
jgi:hypothetical protein